ncbi:MAG: hypothetical protein K0S54_2770, partial [Alphaproteobacteria bacterium]|nr:hypothetical protein [Alphaproteobacteria bacterium]
KRVAIALAVALLALPASAQVEIRGLTIAAPDKPSNGGIMLKGMISTRLPGEVSQLTYYAGVIAKVNQAHFRLVLRHSEIILEPVTIPRSSGRSEIFYNPAVDLDGDGRMEVVDFDKKSPPGRLIVKRQESGSWREIAGLSGFGSSQFTHLTDVTRSGRREIIAIDDNHCLRVVSFGDETLKDLGVLSCGAPLVGDPLIADIDNDTRYDLIVARKPDRIEIFLR